MLQGKVIDNFSLLKPDDLAIKAELVYTCMKGNKNFPKPDPSMEKYGTTLTAFKSALMAAKSKDLAKKEAMKTQKLLMLALMKTLLKHVNTVADGNREMLATTGFTLNAETRATDKKLGFIPRPVAKPGKNSGEEKLSIKAVTNADSYQWQITTWPVTPASVWINLAGKTRCEATDLVPGTQYAARVLVKGTGTQIAESATITFIAI